LTVLILHNLITPVKEAIENIRTGKGPALIEAEVVRLQSHSSSDDQKKYRKNEELEEDMKNVLLKNSLNNL
jgi:TPP-dependent pyruvate/acetoin dehydrogenase alpha subunit